jgi:hypothetical protein
VVVDIVSLLLSLASIAGFKASYTPGRMAYVSELDCVAGHALLRSSPQDRAKLSCALTSSYVGPLYPALHVQFQTDTEPAADALVSTHAEHTVRPVLSAYVFAAQSMHADEPVADLYFPGTHAAHSDPFAPVYPALQMQSVKLVALESEYEFAEHPTHSGPYAPKKPALQKQAVRLVAPESEYEFAEHDWQSQFPVMFLKVPGAHCSQRPAFSPVYPYVQAQS